MKRYIAILLLALAATSCNLGGHPGLLPLKEGVYAYEGKLYAVVDLGYDDAHLAYLDDPDRIRDLTREDIELILSHFPTTHPDKGDQ